MLLGKALRVQKELDLSPLETTLGMCCPSLYFKCGWKMPLVLETVNSQRFRFQKGRFSALSFIMLNAVYILSHMKVTEHFTP